MVYIERRDSCCPTAILFRTLATTLTTESRDYFLNTAHRGHRVILPVLSRQESQQQPPQWHHSRWAGDHHRGSKRAVRVLATSD